MSEAELEMFKKMLRSMLISNKDGIPFYTIEAEYKSLVGEDIPYKKFGFKSAQEFLTKMTSDAIRPTVNRLGREVFIAVCTEETKHIEKLVRLQKKPTNKRSKKKHALSSGWYFAPNYRSASHKQSYHNVPHATLSNKNSRAPGKKDFHHSAAKSFSDPDHRVAVKSMGFQMNPKDSLNSSQPKPRNSSLSANSRGLMSFDCVPPRQQLPPRFQKSQQAARQQQNTEIEGATVPRKSVFDRLGPSVSDDGSSFIVEVPIDSGTRKVLPGAKPLPLPGRQNMNRSSASKGTSVRCLASPVEESQGFGSESRSISLSSRLGQVSLSENNNNIEVKDVDVNLLRSRITMLLEIYKNGIWVNQLSRVYLEAYKQPMPGNLKSLLEAWTDIVRIEKIGAEKMLKAQSSGLQTAKKPDKLVLDDTWQHDVYVSFVKNSAELCLRILGDHHSVLLEDMEESFMKMKLKRVDMVTEGLICLLLTDMEVKYESDDGVFQQSEECYNRVEVTKVKGHMVEVKHLDHGGSEEVELKRLFSMPTGITLPYQAIHCHLEGLEAFANDETISKLLQQNLLGKTCLAKGVCIKGKADVFAVDLIEYEDDRLMLNVNEKFQALAYKPQIPDKPNALIDASVSSVSYNGHIYFHVADQCLDRISSLLSKANWLEAKSLSSHLAENKDDLKLLTFAKISDSGQWLRAKLLDTISAKEVRIRYIDVGSTEIVDVSDLMVLSPAAHGAILNFPPQAVCCRIADLPEKANDWTAEAFLQLSQKLLCKGTKVVIKVCEKIDSYHIIGEIRLQDLTAKQPDQTADALLCRFQQLPSVNELMSQGNEKLWVSLKPSEVQRPSSGDEVYITDCQDPGNFKGVPMVCFNELRQMMSDLQEFYAKHTTHELIPTLDSLCPGRLYAVKHFSDGLWHRAIVAKIINKNLISVRFVDSGRFYPILSVARFRYLPNQFLQLPLLSFDMTLAGFVHNGLSWSQEDAEVLGRLILCQTFRVFIPKNVQIMAPLPVTLVCPRVCDNPFIHQVLLKDKLVTSAKSYSIS